MSESLLSVENLNAYYDKAHILQDVSFQVNPLERVAILGRNGMGKSTLFKSILGLEKIRREGDVYLNGHNVMNKETFETANLGVAYVPQGWQLFPSLSVDEHLQIAHTPHAGEHEWTPDSVYELFPEIKARKKVSGTKLSGGEQQMLAIARALVRNPWLILMDEPSEGISTFVIERVIEVCQHMAERNVSLLLVEQNLDLALRAAQKVYILVNGRIVYTTSTEDFKEDKESQIHYLGV
ncbi:ABC transporter ATP-binding protein [Natribacillus halophilus]|uniref:Amino acid/amide ABC transporter ATP-binding protein 2, HAAT family n=1 Tax=Natribacillus halophilus TaxID=549003 RepID=A0A1G8KGA5_9BACI|nr:ABC transporter ATP-binding protein [Natribacillus halophilus]SDI42422.1 amino acid/amide ABC transporter ATP-binding protein 2, HAAT family [Natribacillus halophilus]